MRVEDIVALCHKANVSLTQSDDNLVVHAEEGALTPELISLLKNNKPALLSWLSKKGRSKPAQSHIEQKKSIVIGHDFINQTKEQRHPPIPVISAPNRHWMFRRKGKNNFWVVNHHIALSHLAGKVTFEVFEKAMVALMVMHETLRLNFDASSHEERIVDVGTVLGYQPIVELDGALPTKELVDLIADRIQAIRVDECMFRAFFLDDEDHSYVLLSMHHALFDAYGMRTLAKDFDRVVRNLVAENNEPIPYWSNQYPAWCNQLKDYACGRLTLPDGSGIEKDAEFWFKQPWNAISKVPLDRDSQHLDTTANKVGLNVSVSAPDALRISRLAKALVVDPMDIHIYALAKALNSEFGMEKVLFELSNMGRQYAFTEQDGGEIFAYMVSSSPLIIDIDEAVTASRGIKESHAFRKAAPNSGLGLGFLRYLTDDRQYRAQASEIPHPEINYNYLAAVGGFEKTKSGIVESVVKGKGAFLKEKIPHVVEDEDMEKNCVFYILTENTAEGGLRTHFEYCHRLFSEEKISALATSYLTELMSAINELDPPAPADPNAAVLANVDSQYE